MTKGKSVFQESEVTTNRLETLTDGIFSVAMTLLILEVKVPELVSGASNQMLWHSLVELWSHLVSFGITFIVLGMFWIGHHTEFWYIRKLDHTLIWLNILYLLFISVLPFSAALLGRYPTYQPSLIVYGVHLIFMVLVHYVMWHHATHQGLVDGDVITRMTPIANRMGYVAMLGYVLAIALSFVSWKYSLFLYIVIPIPYIFGIFYRVR